MRTARFLVALIAVLAALWVATRPRRHASEPDAPPARVLPGARKLALLVGIDRCQPGTPLPELYGCVADIHAARALLEARFGFATDEVLELADEAATHEAIVRAWREFLIARAGPGTQAVFWFAGHGSQVPDASGRDPSGRGCDQTLIAWDSRAHGEDGAYDLSDDELFVLGRELEARGAELLAITDACHSATALRGDEPQAPRARGADAGRRALERGRIAGFWRGLDWIDDDDPRAAAPQSSVQIAACAAEQRAYEHLWTDAGGVAHAHGVLDYFLLQELRAAQPGESCAALLERVAARVRGAVLRQDPCGFGALERPLLGGAFAPAPRGYRARMQGEGLLIEAGTLLGLAPGSALAVEDGRGTRLSEPAVVESSTALQSRARWPGATALAAGVELFVREERGSRRGRRIRLASESVPEALREGLSRIADLVPLGLGCELVLRGAPGEFVLRDAEGLVLWRQAAEGAAVDLQSALARELEAELVYRELLLVRASETQDIAARFVPLGEQDRTRLRADKLSGLGFDPHLVARPELGAAVWSLRAGSGDPPALVKLELENHGRREVCVQVLSVSEDRKRLLVTKDQRALRLAPGARESLVISVQYVPGLGLERALLEHYLVIAAPDPPQLGALLRSETTRDGAGPPELQDGAQIGLLELLVERAR